MAEQHPITPPPKLVEQWMREAHDQPPGPDARLIATLAARWGSDQELEACCEWLDDDDDRATLRAARRPKPPSLKEQALAVIENSLVCDHLSTEHAGILRRALEALDD